MIGEFLKLKNHPDNKVLDDDTQKLIFSLFNINTKTSVNNNVLNSSVISHKKYNIANKFITILNKLTKVNLNTIINEYIDTFGKLSFDDHSKLQIVLLNKLLNEITFLDTYTKFIVLINKIYNASMNYNIYEFIHRIQVIFEGIYNNKEKDDNIEEIENHEDKRKNLLYVIKKLSELYVLKNNVINYCEDILLKNTKYPIDIFVWFEKKTLTENDKIKINTYIDNNNDISFRTKTLLNTLIEK